MGFQKNPFLKCDIQLFLNNSLNLICIMLFYCFLIDNKSNLKKEFQQDQIKPLYTLVSLGYNKITNNACRVDRDKDMIGCSSK